MWAQLVDWLARVRGWLCEGRMAWGALLAVPALPLLLILLSESLASNWEDRLRLTGMGLELAGLILVIMKLTDLRKQFGLEKPAALLWIYLKQFPRWRVPGGTGSFDELLRYQEAIDTRAGQLTVAKSPDNRLDVLEPRVYALENRVRGLQGNVGSGLASVRREREAGEERSQKLLKEATTGKLYLDLIGAVFLIFGVILATASKEIMGLVCRITGT